MVVLVVRHQEMPKRAQYPAGIFSFALLRWKRESQPCLLGTQLSPHQLPPRLSEQLEELSKAFQCSTKCQVSVSRWQASPKGTIFCCHHLPAFFLLLFFGAKALRSVLHHSRVHYRSSARCCPLPLSCLCHWSPSTRITGVVVPGAVVRLCL